MIIYDETTNIALADPEVNPLAHRRTTPQLLAETIQHYILSASGWRNIFAIDGDPESLTKEISTEDSYISAIMAYNFVNFLSKTKERPVSELTVLVAVDTRPTGPAIADMMIRTLLAMGAHVTYTFITAAPEAMAYSALSFDLDGFIYISASHNPVGYNGVKFGHSGKVLGPADSATLIASFTELLQMPEIADRIFGLLDSLPSSAYEQVLKAVSTKKQEALDQYRMFTGSVAAGSLYICGQDQIYNTIHHYADTYGIGILADFNGSARTRSIDENLLDSLGVTFRMINTAPGVFAHRIVPEGESLDACRIALEEAYHNDPSFVFGYVPDCDGDRGNIVYIDEMTGTSSILEAQEVFALVALSELSYISLKQDRKERLAIAVNGPTSMRIDSIAACFGADVFRAEVGEANVVQLAEDLRNSGYEVRILGEGSNGGNITYPASVRDPLNTVISLLKLLTFRGDADGKGLFRHWCELSGQTELYTEHFSLSDIIETLPKYQTTSAYEERAIMHISTSDHEVLKSRYEELFAEFWNANSTRLRDEMGIVSWKEFNTTGTKEIEGVGKEAREDSSKGGLKIVFYDADDNPTDYIWMRGSGTEPVFRVLADCRGSDPSREERLLSLHKDLITRADTQ